MDVTIILLHFHINTYLNILSNVQNSDSISNAIHVILIQEGKIQFDVSFTIKKLQILDS